MTTLVWIDARAAVIVRWTGDEAVIDRIRSAVPPRRRSTGHVRHDPRLGHGGGNSPITAGEPRRLERLARFVETVAGRLPNDGDLAIIGPGTVRTRLAAHLREADRRAGLERTIEEAAASRLTDPQLVARARELAGDEAPRRVVGGDHRAGGS